jgi:hypothetical protein
MQHACILQMLATPAYLASAAQQALCTVTRGSQRPIPRRECRHVGAGCSCCGLVEALHLAGHVDAPCRLHTQVRVCMCMSVSVCMYTCVRVHECVRMCVCVCVCVNARAHVRVCVHVRLWVCFVPASQVCATSGCVDVSDICRAICTAFVVACG